MANCPTCGLSEGHKPNCSSLFELAQEWLGSEGEGLWKERYDLIVRFLLNQVGALTQIVVESEVSS